MEPDPPSKSAPTSRKEKRKALKKQKRRQLRKETAVKEREEEEALANDPKEQLRVRIKEQEEAEKAERARREFEEREKAWVEAAERRKVEEEASRKALLEELEKAKEHPKKEGSDVEEDCEYVEEGPAEIIWRGNEIIVKKKRVKVKRIADESSTKKLEDDRPTSNPFPPQSMGIDAFSAPLSAQDLLESVAQQTPNFGTEQDKAHCPFHLKTGACRFGSRCSRVHFYPDKSCTLLIKNMYNGPGLAWEQDEGLESTDEEIEKSYEEFYEDVHTEFLKFGELVNFKVCRNGLFHLRGNVYVHYKSMESAVLAQSSMNGRYFAGKQIACEFVGVTKWKVAICGEYMKSRLKTCSRGTTCNFIHCFRNPGGDYEWADWDSPPPRYWVKKMVALFGPSDEFEGSKSMEYEQLESADSSQRRRPSSDRFHLSRFRHSDVDFQDITFGKDGSYGHRDQHNSSTRHEHSSRKRHSHKLLVETEHSDYKNRSHGYSSEEAITVEKDSSVCRKERESKGGGCVNHDRSKRRHSSIYRKSRSTSQCREECHSLHKSPDCSSDKVFEDHYREKSVGCQTGDYSKRYAFTDCAHNNSKREVSNKDRKHKVSRRSGSHGELFHYEKGSTSTSHKETNDESHNASNHHHRWSMVGESDSSSGDSYNDQRKKFSSNTKDNDRERCISDVDGENGHIDFPDSDPSRWKHTRRETHV